MSMTTVYYAMLNTNLPPRTSQNYRIPTDARIVSSDQCPLKIFVCYFTIFHILPIHILSISHLIILSIFSFPPPSILPLRTFSLT